MRNSFLYNTPSLLIVAVLVGLMLLLYYLGFKVKQNKRNKYGADIEEGLGPMEGSLLGLLALLLSFTFSMSSSRHDKRFDVMVAEANSIGTAILRADLFPDSERTVLRSNFKTYVDARIALYKAANDPQKNAEAAAATEKAAQKLWQMAVKATQSSDAAERNRGSMMLTSLNEVIDAITNRKASRNTMIPESILYLLFLLCLASSFIVGYGTKRKADYIVAIGFVVMIGITVFSILDLDRPHRGLITLDKAEQNLEELRQML